MIKNNFLSFLGLCQKSGKVISGDYAMDNNLKKNNKIKFIIIAKDASENIQNKYNNIANEKNVEIINYCTKQELGYAIGKESRAIIGLTDVNQIKKIKNLYKDA